MPNPTQPEPPTEAADHDEPVFPWTGVLTYGVAVLVFAALAVILVLDTDRLTRIAALFSAGLAGYLAKVPVGYVHDWHEDGLVDGVDDGLDLLDVDPDGQP